MHELELLKINAILHQFKGALPLLALSMNETSFEELDPTLLELREQMQQVQEHLLKIRSQSSPKLWQQMQNFMHEVIEELDQLLLQFAKRWLLAGSPTPRPSSLQLIKIDPALEMGLS